jgi:hypothetical protein
MTTSLSVFNLGTLEMKTEELLLTDVHALRAQRLLGNSWKTLKISDIYVVLFGYLFTCWPLTVQVKRVAGREGGEVQVTCSRDPVWYSGSSPPSSGPDPGPTAHIVGQLVSSSVPAALYKYTH